MSRPDLLSMPNIPKPLHGLNPRTIMGKTKWDTKRQEIYASTDYHCAACGVHKYDAKFHTWLEAHEIFDIDYPNSVAHLIEIVPLCHACHMFIHSGLLAIQHRKGNISSKKARRVLRHGADVLRTGKGRIFPYTLKMCKIAKIDTTGLTPTNIPSIINPWKTWKMKWDGEVYQPKFKSMKDWKMHYDAR